MPENSYSEKDIQYLEPREHIRRRPGMYVGGTDARAMHHVADEIIDYFVNENYKNRCDHIWIELRPDNEISVRGNGEGMPVDTPFGEQTSMELILESIGICAPGHRLEVYGSLHGVGITASNALCSKLVVENYRDGALWTMTYAEGKPQGPLQRQDSDHETGTIITFTPDFTIFDQNDFDLKHFESRAQEIAFTMPELTIVVRDTRVEPAYEKVFHYPDGMKSLVEQLNEGKTALHEPVHIRQDVVINPPYYDEYTFSVEIAFQFTQSEESHVRGYANTLETPHDGTHVAGLKAGLWSCITEYIASHEGWYEPATPLTWEALLQGLVAVVSIHHPDVQYEGTRTMRLLNPEVYAPIAGLVFNHAFRREYKDVERILDHHLSRRTDNADLKRDSDA